MMSKPCRGEFVNREGVNDIVQNCAVTFGGQELESLGGSSAGFGRSQNIGVAAGCGLSPGEIAFGIEY